MNEEQKIIAIKAFSTEMQKEASIIGKARAGIKGFTHAVQGKNMRHIPKATGKGSVNINKVRAGANEAMDQGARAGKWVRNNPKKSVAAVGAGTFATGYIAGR